MGTLCQHPCINMGKRGTSYLCKNMYNHSHIYIYVYMCVNYINYIHIHIHNISIYIYILHIYIYKCNYMYIYIWLQIYSSPQLPILLPRGVGLLDAEVQCGLGPLRCQAAGTPGPWNLMGLIWFNMMFFGFFYGLICFFIGLLWFNGGLMVV